jgi:hypothetical protein
MNVYAAVLIFWIIFGVGFLFGALWRDGRAARKEKALSDRIEAQRLLILSYEAEIKWTRSALAGKSGKDFKPLEDTLEIFQAKRAQCSPGTLEEKFNAGAIHGLNAALLQLRGWL